MAVTLEAAAQNAVDDLDLSIINEFRTSTLIDALPFEDAVNPIGGGGTLTYSYRRETALADAAFRAINTEYTPANLPPTTRHSVDLHPLGGAFEVDRVFRNVGPAQTNEISRNMSAVIRAASAKFSETFITGDSSAQANSFDGLSKTLAGTTTEVLDTSEFDISGAMTEEKAWAMLDLLDALLVKVEGTGRRVIIANDKFIRKAIAAARRLSVYVEKPGPLHSYRHYYGDVELIDAGKGPGQNKDIIANDKAQGTDVYAARLALDGVHGVSLAGQPLVQYWLPNFNQAKAVHRGEVELGPVAVAMKSTKAAAVFRGVKL